MEELEYTKWIVTDTSQMVLQALAIYGVALIAYWTLVG